MRLLRSAFLVDFSRFVDPGADKAVSGTQSNGYARCARRHPASRHQHPRQQRERDQRKAKMAMLSNQGARANHTRRIRVSHVKASIISGLDPQRILIQSPPAHPETGARRNSAKGGDSMSHGQAQRSEKVIGG